MVIFDINVDVGKVYVDIVECLLGEECFFCFIEEEKKGFFKCLFGG